MSDSPFRSLSSDTDWQEALSQSEDTPVLVFKHSSACPVSGQAHAEMTEFAKEENVPVYTVVVQENRSVSEQIESHLDVQHETPQAILIRDRSPVFDTSHFNVTVDTLREELRRATSSSN